MSKNSLNKRIGEELLDLIKKNASTDQIAHWADGVYSNHCRELESEVDNLITKISFMQLGPEFEINRSELEVIAVRLMQNDR